METIARVPNGNTIAIKIRALLHDPKTILMAIIVSGLLWFGVFPIVLLVAKAFQVGNGYGLDNFAATYSNPANTKAILTTIAASLFTALASLLLSVPLAWVLARTDLPAKSALRTLVIAPYMVPPFVGAIAWTYLANPKVGYINRLLTTWLGDGVLTIDIYSIVGLVLVQTIFFFPLSFLAISNAMERMDPAIEEAARVSGAGRWRTFQDVTLPLITPNIVAGGLLVFLAVAATFGVPAIIGLPAGIEVVTTRIVRSVYVGTPEALRQSTAMAVMLMIMAIGVLAISNFILAKRQYITVTGQSRKLEPSRLGRWRWPLAVLTSGVTLMLVFIPLGSLIMTTFVKAMGQDIGGGNWTLAHWQNILTQAKTWNTIRVSLLLAVGTATIGLVAGYVISYIKVRTNLPGKNIPDFLVTFTYGTPGIVVALGMIIAFSGAFGLNLYGTFAILIFAYLAHMLAYSVRIISAAMEQIHPSLEEAAISCGAGWLQATWDVSLPLLRTALVESWFMIFVRALYELTISVLLYSMATMTAGVYLYDLESYADPQSSAVLSALILVLVLGGTTLMRLVTRGKISL